MPPKVPSANRGSRDMLLCQRTVLFRCAAKVVDLNSLKMFVFERTCQKTARQFPNTRIILDATEIMINKPGKVNDQRCTWSSYNTLKAMIGGVVTYVSKAYIRGCNQWSPNQRKLRAAEWLFFRWQVNYGGPRYPSIGFVCGSKRPN